MIQQEPIEIFIGCDNWFYWDEMVDAPTGVQVPDAAPTFALKDSASATVSGSTGTMSTVTGKRARYQAFLPSTLSLTVFTVAAANYYYLEITTSIGGKDDFRRIQCKAVYRGLR